MSFAFRFNAHLVSLFTVLLLVLLLMVARVSYANDLTLEPSKDSFLRSGSPDTNEGANKRLNIHRVGKRRAVIAFDLSTLNSQIPAGEKVISADLQLFITNNNRFWSKKGRPVGVHMLLEDWSEGNGANAKVPRFPDNDDEEERPVRKNRGTGAGVTWRCATDTDISNKKTDCTIKWRGGSFNSVPTDVATVTNNTTGSLSFDVTSDVQKFLAATFQNFGWLIKKTGASKAGGIWLASREASSNHPALNVTTGYAFTLTGEAEVPPVSTTATGNCTVSLNNAETILQVDCTHTVANTSMAHIHQGAVGVDGPVVCDLGSGISPISTTCAMSPSIVTALRDGLLYVNVHSAANPGGEVRGQIANVD